MTLLPVLAGLLVAPVVAAAVYLDGRRRGRSTRTRTAWAAGTGAAALGGFALPVVAEDAVVSAYADLVRPGPVVVVVTPFELVGVHLAVGVVVAVAVVAAYGVVSRGRRG